MQFLFCSEGNGTIQEFGWGAVGRSKEDDAYDPTQVRVLNFVLMSFLRHFFDHFKLFFTVYKIENSINLFQF